MLFGGWDLPTDVIGPLEFKLGLHTTLVIEL